MTNKKSHTKETDSGSLEVNEELIRQRAYGYYEERGREDGHDLEDWFRAEAEIAGRRLATQRLCWKQRRQALLPLRRCSKRLVAGNPLNTRSGEEGFAPMPYNFTAISGAVVESPT